jgi:hypothetical protein
MRRSSHRLALAWILVVATGCAKQYVVLQPLDVALPAPVTIAMGEVTDDLPIDTEPERRPRPEEIAKLERSIETEIAKRDLGNVTRKTESDALYEVQARFLEFDRGSGVARFFFGWGLGTARATVALRLVERSSGRTAFAGNFTATVSSWAESGDQIFRRIAHDFARELERQQKKPS